MFDHVLYNKERAAKRKADWLKENGPCKSCGSWNLLEVDHIDPSTKSFSISFTESKTKLLEELTKCQTLCHECHLVKSIGETKALPISCRNGHLWEDNYKVRKRGLRFFRVCRQCERDSKIRYIHAGEAY